MELTLELDPCTQDCFNNCYTIRILTDDHMASQKVAFEHNNQSTNQSGCGSLVSTGEHILL